MTVNNPIAYLFAAVIPIIVALYLLRLQRKKRLVSSTFFWTEMIQDLQANVPFQKLRWNILLLLQILIAIAIVLAMIDPSVRGAMNEGRRTIFVVDTSASMLSNDEGGSRLDKVVDDIGTYCRNLSEREQVMIIEAGEHARVALEFTDRIQAITRTLDSLEVQDTRSDMATGYALAVSKASEVDQPQIVIASDFSGVDLGLFVDPEYPVSFLKVGSSSSNAAITDFQITGIGDDESGLVFNAFIAVRNYTDREIESDIEFYADGNLVDVRQITIEAGARSAKVFQNIPYPGGVIEAHLDMNDSLALDNVAYAKPPEDVAMDVLIAGDDPFLLLALAGIPGIRLYQISESEFAPGADYDLVFFPGWAPEELSAGNYVFFSPPDRDYLPATVSGQVNAPRVTDWEDGNQMLRFVNPGSFNVFIARKLEPLPGSITLIDGDSTPLMVYGERDYLRALVFPFELSSTDLITRPTFPILIYNIVSFFRSQTGGLSSGLRTQGIEAVRIDALGEKVKLTGPDGIELEFPIDAGHAFIDVNRAGVYVMEVEGNSDAEPTVLVANFFDEAESDISVPANLETEIGEGEITRFEIEGEKHIWKWVSVIALLILSVEWFFYHRKGF